MSIQPQKKFFLGQGPFKNGTKYIYEELAIVHALILEQRRITHKPQFTLTPVTALALRNKKAKTLLEITDETKSYSILFREPNYSVHINTQIKS